MCAFQNSSRLTSITIPASVIKIDPWTFRGCTGLQVLTVDNENPVYCSEDNSIYTKDKKKLIAAASGLSSVAIPDGVTEIGEHAFSGHSGLTCVAIPDGVTEIGEHAFSGHSGLTCVVIPDSVTVIGARAFSDCTALTGVTIPASVTEIADEVFSGCTCLTELTVDSENPIYCSENNSIYTKDKKKLVAAAGGLKGQFVIPDGVTEICSWAFSGCSGLTHVTLPASVSKIDLGAFSDCTGLKNITIHSSRIEITLWIFSGINPDTHFTVKTDAVKTTLKKIGAIQDEYITVEPDC